MAKPKKPDETRTDESASGARAEERRGFLIFLLTILGTVLMVGTAVGSAVHFYETKAFELKKEELTQHYRRVEEDLRQQYERQLRSIQYGTDGEERHFDVTDFFISPTAAYALPSTVRRFELSADNVVFVDNYQAGDWSNREIDELSLTEMMVGPAQALREAENMGLVEELRASKLLMFRPRRQYTIDVAGRRRVRDAAPRLTFFPVVIGQPVVHETMAEALRISDERLKSLLEARDAATNPRAREHSEAEIALLLNDAFRTDFGGTVLKAFVDEGFRYVEQYEDVEYRLLSVQKRGNVLFIQSVLTFLNVPELSGKNLHIEEMSFLINAPGRSFVVRTFVPSYAGNQSADHDWVRRWLAGLKILWV